MKRNVFLSSAIAVLAAIMASCASMTVVGLDESSVEGPKQVRQYGEINPGSITVYAYYKDDSRKRAAVSANNINFDSSRPGTQNVIVTVSGYRAGFQTEVMPLTGISVVTQNAAWRQGSPVRIPRSGGAGTAPAAPGNDHNNWPGLEIQAEWQGMGSEKLSARDISDDCVFSEFNTGTVGRYDVTVTWRDMRTTFPVNVVALQSIRVDRAPFKTKYVQGESLNSTGLKVMGTWPGLPDSEVNGSVGGYDTNKVGRQTLTVTYRGQSARFEVEVTAKPAAAPPPAAAEPPAVAPTAQSIVGRWNHERGVGGDGMSPLIHIYTFNADGTFMRQSPTFENTLFTSMGTYTVSGNTLTWTYDDGTVLSGTFSISGSWLTIDFNNGADGYVMNRNEK